MKLLNELAALCCRLIAEHSCGGGKMHIYIPAGTLRRVPIVSPVDGSHFRMFVEMNLTGCAHKIVIEVNFSETTDCRNPLTTSVKTSRGLDILHIHGLSLAGSQAGKAICRLLLSTDLDVNIITLFAHEASAMSIHDFAAPPWRGAVMRYVDDYLGYGS